jgi:non-ribosomal peptide synthetase component E (peptide arylation enzyme)
VRPTRYTQEIPRRYINYFDQPTLTELFDRYTVKHAHNEAIVDPKTRMTWAESKRWSDRVAMGLAGLGLSKDDVVAVQVPNIAEAFLLRLALRKAGIIGLMLGAAFREKELQYMLESTKARGIAILPAYNGRNYLQIINDIRPDLPELKYILVAGDDVPEGTTSIKEMAEGQLDENFSPEDMKERGIGRFEVSELWTTSGTTGIPRIVQIANPYYSSGLQFAERWKLTHEDVFGLLSPHSGGAASICYCLSFTLGAELVMQPSFEPELALELIQKERITFAVGVPTQLEMILKYPDLGDYDLSSLRIVCVSGAYASPATLRKAEEIMNCYCVTLFGGVEFGHFSSTSQHDSPEVRWTSIGKAFSYNEGKVVDETGNELPKGQTGELTCKTPNSAGFHNSADATLQAWGGDFDGWYGTGDLAKEDDEGNFHIVGRIKDIIKRGGYPIAPAEIEEMLISHPKVQSAAVVPMPDPIYGEKVCAYIIPTPGQDFTFKEMVSFLKKRRIASYKLPERLEIVDRFPLENRSISSLGLLLA